MDHLGARSMELDIASNSRCLHVEFRVPRTQPEDGTMDPPECETGRPGTDMRGTRLEKLKTQLEAVGGQFELQMDVDGEVRPRVSTPLSPLHH